MDVELRLGSGIAFATQRRFGLGHGDSVSEEVGTRWAIRHASSVATEYIALFSRNPLRADTVGGVLSCLVGPALGEIQLPMIGASGARRGCSRDSREG